MVSRDKVIWSEGMFLRPQHFQQFERHMLHTAQQRAATLQGCFWGFGLLSLDRDALAIGKVALTRAQGVMPDGTPFRF
ncbi:type VI secretion system baseplate subunit TssK, partial [Achromobacter xylosoxidans]